MIWTRDLDETAAGQDARNGAHAWLGLLGRTAGARLDMRGTLHPHGTGLIRSSDMDWAPSSQKKQPSLCHAFSATMNTKTTMIEKEISRQAFKTKSLKEVEIQFDLTICSWVWGYNFIDYLDALFSTTMLPIDCENHMKRLEELEERERKIALSMSEYKETEGDLSKRLQKLTAKENQRTELEDDKKSSKFLLFCRFRAGGSCGFAFVRFKYKDEAHRAVEPPMK
ncbi:hypothetical protein Bca52824_017814 [Brassica carinata]|uniref:Uncharacterized protein n=1 Tax=Brassica carinata TaxID=52824 RepID=A0A8X8AXS5_BRACI|nr:hypothetical protein Bca52824_017814 [Brassica carinata]